MYVPLERTAVVTTGFVVVVVVGVGVGVVEDDVVEDAVVVDARGAVLFPPHAPSATRNTATANLRNVSRAAP